MQGLTQKRPVLLLKPLTLAVAALVVQAPLQALAQAESGLALEEIIVTSQKREQNLQDIPASVAAVDGVKIEKMGIENLEDLTNLIPNLHFTETGISTQMRVRGIGSDNSQGFEQSVGVFKDGIYHSRAQLFRAPMFDLERIEVMRGPQGTLFGKNTIAGAIETISAKPTDTLEGKVTGAYESEYATQELNAFVAGPLSDSFKGRLALRAYQDPGFMSNTIKSTDEADVDEMALRGSLQSDVNDNLSVLLVAEHNTYDIVGRAIEITQDLPATAGPAAGLNYGRVLGLRNQGITFDSLHDFNRQTNAPEYSDNQLNTVTLRADYHADPFVFTSLTGILNYAYDEKCDCDFTPANIFTLDMQEDYEQLSQEFRFASEGSQTVDWLGGIFYQTYDQTFDDQFNIDDNSTLKAFLPPAIPAFFYGTGVQRQFVQNSDTWAIFGEVVWHLTDAFSLNLGARYTEEQKSATKVVELFGVENPDTPIAGVPLITRVAGIYASNLFLTQTQQLPGGGHSLDKSRDESSFTPTFTANLQINDDYLTYLKFSKGFKAGGFDPRSNNRNSFEFEEEEVQAVEWGNKMRLADGQFELNTAFFHMKYDNLQISQYDGAVGFNVGNAKDTRVQGVEMDGRWQIASHWTSHYGLAFLDFEYRDFKNGNCYFGQTPSAQGFCDYSGKRGVYTPEWTVNYGLEYSRPVKSLEFSMVIDAQWVDKQQVHVNLDPKGVIDDYTMLDLRIALDGERWGLALLGKNLLDEHVLSYSANMPLSEKLVQSNTYYSFLRRPTTVALEASFKF